MISYTAPYCKRANFIFTLSLMLTIVCNVIALGELQTDNIAETNVIDLNNATYWTSEEEIDEIKCAMFHYRTTCLAHTECNWCCNAPFGSQCFSAENNSNTRSHTQTRTMNSNTDKCQESATLHTANETCAMACSRANNQCESCELMSWCYYCMATRLCQSPEMTCVGSTIVQECSVEYDDSDSVEFAKRLFLISFIMITSAVIILIITRVVKYFIERSESGNEDNNHTNNNNNNNDDNNNNITVIDGHSSNTQERHVPHQTTHSFNPASLERQPLLSSVNEDELFSPALTGLIGNTRTNNSIISTNASSNRQRENALLVNPNRSDELIIVNGDNHNSNVNVSENNINIDNNNNSNDNDNNNQRNTSNTMPKNNHDDTCNRNAHDQNTQITASSTNLPHISSFVIDDDHMCYLCLAARSTVTFLPCYHMCCCETCSNRLRPNEQTLHCPFCRQKIDAMVSLPNIFM